MKVIDILNAQEVQVEQFTLDLAARGATTNDVRHNLQLRIAAHNGGNDSHSTWSLGQRHLSVGAVSVGYVFHLVAMTGDIDEGWRKLHQRVDAVVKTGNVTAFQGRHEFETGKRLFTVIQDVDDFAHCNVMGVS